MRCSYAFAVRCGGLLINFIHRKIEKKYVHTAYINTASATKRKKDKRRKIVTKYSLEINCGSKNIKRTLTTNLTLNLLVNEFLKSAKFD